MKTLLSVVLLFCSALQLSAKTPAEIKVPASGIVFRENKGQWEKNILYKAEIKNGAVFLENNTITFSLYSADDLFRVRGMYHRQLAYNRNIDYNVHCHAFKMHFVNAGVTATTTGTDAESGYSNYFIGNDKSKWASKVMGYQQVTYAHLYNGIDFNVNTKGSQFKYTYTVQPGANPNQLAIDFEGVDGLAVDAEGNLVINTSVGNLFDLKPYAYQTDGAAKSAPVEVPCTFQLNGTRVTYKFPEGYDRSKPLVIDPTLIFSTYSGSTFDNFGYSATYDSKGNAFMAGSCFGAGYPTTTGAYMMNYLGGPDILLDSAQHFYYPGDDMAITKFNATGTQRIYATYLGGYGTDLPHSLIANLNDELYILGTTSSRNYPTTSTAFDTTFNGGTDPGVFNGIAVDYFNGSDIVVSRLSVDGSQLLASTYVGGSDNDGLNYTAGESYYSEGYLRHNYADEMRGDIEIDTLGNIYVASCTNSHDFPHTAGAYRSADTGRMEACVFKMDGNLSHLLVSTTFGGKQDDAAYSLCIDKDQSIYVAGGTVSPDFPATAGVIQDSLGGGIADGFVAHFDKNAQALLEGTFYGRQNYDQIYFVQEDHAGYVYVYGQADSSGTSYIKNAVYNKPNGGEFISKFSHKLDTVIWSTAFGRGLGVTDISPTAFLVDVCSHVYVCGWGSQAVNNDGGKAPSGTLGMDTTSGAYRTHTDGQDFYIMVMQDDASALVYATFFGGNQSPEHVDGGTSRFDKKGIMYEAACAGCGGHSDFPHTPGVIGPHNNSGNCNNAVFKFDLDLPFCVASFNVPYGCVNVPVQLQNTSKASPGATFHWNFGDGTTSTADTPTHSFARGGLYRITLVLTDPGSCNVTDSTVRSVLILGNATVDTLPLKLSCVGQNVPIGIPPTSDPAYTFHWTANPTLSDSTIPNPYATPIVPTYYRLMVSNGVCTDTFVQLVNPQLDSLITIAGDILCVGDTLQLSVSNTSGNTLQYSWQPTRSIVSGANTDHPRVNPLSPTQFTVFATDSFGCSYVDSVQINITSNLPSVHAIAEPDTIIYGDTSQLSLTLSADVTGILWRTDSTLSAFDIANPLAFPKQTNGYIVKVVDSNECKKYDTVIVYVVHTPCSEHSIYIPNGFTPNGDGKNDVLYLRGNDVSDIYFAVYDRWGQRVFDTHDINVGWDGTYKGKKCDPAVFGYYAEGRCGNGDKFFKKGNVTLLR